jgi:hypothetical protein
MPKHLSSILLTAVAGLLAWGLSAPANAQDKKVDPTGTWTWSMGARGGGEARQMTLKLKLEGEKLTGTLGMPGREGAQGRETPIEEGKIKGDEISFQVTREIQGNKMVTKYSGKVSGDTIKGKTETERDGQTRSRDWEAKKQAK